VKSFAVERKITKIPKYKTSPVSRFFTRVPLNTHTFSDIIYVIAYDIKKRQARIAQDFLCRCGADE
jgi:hypothetical protein